MSSLRLILIALLTTFASAETITMVANNRPQTSGQPALSTKTITLEEGDIATALYVSSSATIDITIGNTLIRATATADQRNLPVVVGPARIRVSNFNTFNASLATFKVKRKDAPETASSQVVVIPNDGSGDHEVHIESSADLVTWTPTQAGRFNSTNASRFFRVRVAKVSSD